MDIEDYTNLMKALSDSNRVRIILALRDCELCVCQVIEILGLAPSTVSKHMSILKQAKLIRSRKDGRWIYYKLSEKSPDVVRALSDLTIGALSEDELVIRDKIKLKSVKKYDLYELCRKQRGEKCCP